jgi:hypothetical protein
VLFESGQGTIHHINSGKQVGVFPRKGGLCVGDMKLKNTAYTPTKLKQIQGFTRQELLRGNNSKVEDPQGRCQFQVHVWL